MAALPLPPRQAFVSRKEVLYRVDVDGDVIENTNNQINVLQIEQASFLLPCVSPHLIMLLRSAAHDNYLPHPRGFVSQKEVSYRVRWKGGDDVGNTKDKCIANTPGHAFCFVVGSPPAHHKRLPPSAHAHRLRRAPQAASRKGGAPEARATRRAKCVVVSTYSRVCLVCACGCRCGCGSAASKSRLRNAP